MKILHLCCYKVQLSQTIGVGICTDYLLEVGLLTHQCNVLDIRGSTFLVGWRLQHIPYPDRWCSHTSPRPVRLPGPPTGSNSTGRGRGVSSHRSRSRRHPENTRPVRTRRSILPAASRTWDRSGHQSADTPCESRSADRYHLNTYKTHTAQVLPFRGCTFCHHMYKSYTVLPTIRTPLALIVEPTFWKLSYSGIRNSSLGQDVYQFKHDCSS